MHLYTYFGAALFVLISSVPSCSRPSVTGIPVPLIKVAVSPTISTLTPGLTSKVTATGSYADGTTGDITSQVTWKSANTNVASFGTTPGSLYGVAIGTTTITATSGSLFGTATAVVTNGLTDANNSALVSIAITPGVAASGTSVPTQFTATGLYADGTKSTITMAVTWASSATSVATINSSGLATPLTTGTTNISATLGSIVSPNALLTVSPVTLVSIAVSPTNPVENLLGNPVQLVATGTYSDGSTADLTSSVNWSTLNPIIGTVGNVLGIKGLSLPAGVGSTVVSATLGGVTGSTNLSVVPLGN